jgi:hypothetical protein
VGVMFVSVMVPPPSAGANVKFAVGAPNKSNTR